MTSNCGTARRWFTTASWHWDAAATAWASGPVSGRNTTRKRNAFATGTAAAAAEANFQGRPVKLPAPGPLRDTMQYSEMRVAGNLRAIQVSPSRDLQPLLQLGLWPGDLIIAINGTPVELLSSAEHAINLLGTSKEGQVTIVRNGSRQDITLHREVEPRGPF
jgi:S1-C subfamily serine protease